MTSRRIRVLLLFGGQSAEHDVSRTTAVAVAKALDPDKYEIVPVGITTEGHWLRASGAQAMLESGERNALPAAFEVQGELRSGTDGVDAPRTSTSTSCCRCCTDRTARTGLCRACSSWPDFRTSARACSASAVGMDKIAMKQMLAAAGLPMARYLALRDGHDRRRVRRESRRATSASRAS